MEYFEYRPLFSNTTKIGLPVTHAHMYLLIILSHIPTQQV